MTETIIQVNETKSILKLTASDGMVLTNGDVYGKEIYLGKNDSPSNWHEITDAEYEEIKAAEELYSEDPNVDIYELQQKAAAYDILTGVSE